jgi:hypothetical protein
VVEEGHRGAAVIDDRGETRQRRTLFDSGFGETLGRRLDYLKFDDRGVAQPLDFAQTLGARRYNLGERNVGDICPTATGSRLIPTSCVKKNCNGIEKSKKIFRFCCRYILYLFLEN